MTTALEGRGTTREDRAPSAGASELWTPELYRLHADAERAHWWFRARRRILSRLARRILGNARATVVEVGCGTGGTIAALAAHYTCIGIDPSAEAIRLARERHPRLELIAGDAPEGLPPRARHADLFILADVLEHVDDDRGLLAAILDAAAPGAHLLITVPADPSLWSQHDVTLGHRRRYELTTLAALWVGLPVTARLLGAFNARLYPLVRAARTLGRLRGRPIGARGTDIAVPPRPLNALLERVFAGEADRLVAALDGGRELPSTPRGGEGQAEGARRPPYRRGSSLIAVLRKDPEPNEMRSNRPGPDPPV